MTEVRILIKKIRLSLAFQNFFFNSTIEEIFTSGEGETLFKVAKLSSKLLNSFFFVVKQKHRSPNCGVPEGGWLTQKSHGVD